MATTRMRGLMATTGKVLHRVETLSFPPLGLHCRYFMGHPDAQKATASIDMSKMPGPRVLPGMGTEWLYSPLGPYSIDNLHMAKIEMREKYGPIYKEKLGGHWVLNIHDAKDIEIMMRNEGQYPIREVNRGMVYYRRSCPEHYKGVGLQDASGEEWHHTRSRVNQAVLKVDTMTTMVPRVSDVADVWVSYIKRTRTSDHIIPDIGMALKRFSLDAASSMIFGYRVGALDTIPSRNAEELLQLIRFHLESSYVFGSKTKWHVWRYFPTPAWKKMVVSEQGFQRIFGEMLQDHKEDDGCVVDQLLKHKDLHELDVRTSVQDLLNASMETFGAFMTRVLHRLGQEPRVQDNLRRELDAALGDPTKKLTWKDLSDIPYLKATVKETYRLLSIIPSLFRVTPKNLKLHGYDIPAYTPIIAQTYAECLRDENFSRAMEFIPERWLKSKDLNKEQLEHYENQVGDLDGLRQETRVSRFLVQPFSFGARSCVGRRMAETNIYVMLAKIILNFKLESHGDLELQYIPFLVPKHSLAVVLKDR